MTDRTPPGDGAQAEYYLARAADVARGPASVDRARAAVTPASAFAAWQWLIDRAPIAAGQPPAWAASPSKSPAGEAPGWPRRPGRGTSISCGASVPTTSSTAGPAAARVGVERDRSGLSSG